MKQAAGLGAAICAAVGAGAYRYLPEAAQTMVAPWDAIRYPTTNEQVRAVYQAKYEQWVALYSRTMDLVNDKVMPPMWKAAGVRIGQLVQAQ